MEDKKDKDNHSINSDIIIEEENSIKENNSDLGEGNDSIEEEEIIPSNREAEIKELISSFQENPKKLYSLLNQITKLESKIKNLKQKNDELIKNNLHNDKLMKKISHVGDFRRKFSVGIKVDKSMQITELLKEKNDLQEMNENMLNLLTEKELENEDLQEKFQDYKEEMKIEIKNYIDTIEELEGKLSESGMTKEDFDNKIEEIIKEYNRYKERMEESIRQSINKEEELNNELDKKDKIIEDMKYEMDNLEIENSNLKNINEQNIKSYNSEINDINLINMENEKLKNEVSNYQNRMKALELKTQKAINTKDEEIESLKNELELNNKNFSKIKEEKNKEITQLKLELNKNQTSINIFIKKNESNLNEITEMKNNILTLQSKLDKKTKELQELNESVKKLKENRDNLIKEYEDKIEEIMKDKNGLIEQNHELLDKMKGDGSQNLGNLGELLAEENEEDNNNNNGNNDGNNYEIALLKQEIKSLKEKVQNQNNDLLTLDSMEKEVIRLKAENEQLTKDYKNLKLKKTFEDDKKEIKKYNIKRYTSSVKKITNKGIRDTQGKKSALQRFTTSKIKEFINEDDEQEEKNKLKKINDNKIIEEKNEEENNDKKEEKNETKKNKVEFNMSNTYSVNIKGNDNNKMNDKLQSENNSIKEEINEYKEKMKKNKKEIDEKNKEIGKLYSEIIELKAKYANIELENDISLSKYKGVIKSILRLCKIHKIKINVNLDDL